MVFFIELRIILIIFLAEVYNCISLRSFKRFFSIEIFLDNQCLGIANSLKNIYNSSLIFDVEKELILLTRLQKGGGLGKIYNKIIAGKTTTTLSTGIFEFRTFDSSKNIKDKKIVKIYSFGIVSRIRKILAYLSNPNLEKIHILNDSCDPLIYITYLIFPKDSKKFVFYHHADHTFCFGALEKNWNHIDLFQNQYEICKKRLNPIFNSMINFL